MTKRKCLSAQTETIMKYSQSSIPYQYHFKSQVLALLIKITNVHALPCFFMSGLILAFASRGQYAEALKTALDDSPTRAKDETCKVSAQNVNYLKKETRLSIYKKKKHILAGRVVMYIFLACSQQIGLWFIECLWHRKTLMICLHPWNQNSMTS